jgi:metal-sulfur cluster biosynthetic enzyme
VLATPTVADADRPLASDDDVVEAMKDVVDPELGHQRRRPGPALRPAGARRQHRDAGHDAHVRACPLTDVIEDQTRSALAPIVDDVRINWVWMPPWGPDKITDDGRDQLRALGFNV